MLELKVSDYNTHECHILLLSVVTTFQHIMYLIITIVSKGTTDYPFCNGGYKFYMSRGGAYNPKYKDALQVEGSEKAARGG
jgi:hypothetical protein